MCGIVGWFDYEKNLSGQGDIFNKMAETLNHRGPDAKGTWLTNNIGLAHRRLIVIDPEGGKQPMVYRKGGRTIAVTYNGEIYNFIELRKELADNGHDFLSYSDTEVLLHSYIEWGEDCVRHLNGIFAFGLWDEEKKQLMIARDHLGVKPLFYAVRGSSVFFASEQKALLAHPLVKPEVKAEGLLDILTGGSMHTPGFSVFHGISEVRPGHYITFSRDRFEKKVQYWALQSKPHTEDLNTTVDHIRSLLEDTVKRQLISDVPVVCLLSGGLDSSGITAMASREFRQSGKRLETFSVDFEESSRYFVANPLRPSLDEPWVKRVSDYTNTKHQTITVTSGELLDNMLVPMHAHDAPGIGQLETSMYLMFKKIKQNATVALSGESADEVFGGYPWFMSKAPLKAKTFPWLAVMKRIVDIANRIPYLSKDITKKEKPYDYIKRRYREALAEVPFLKGETPLESKRREIFYMNLTRFLPVLLDRKDRMSMAVGFEVRVPFCDYRLVDYVWNVPWEMKITDNIEKGILRRAFKDVLPDDARNRRKSAYPASAHPDYIAGLRYRFNSILHDPNSPVNSVVNNKLLRTLARIKLPVIPASGMVMMMERLILTDAWLKDYKVAILN
jgi:asparagine synthase (glutamine-hydrolysing)